MRAIASTPTRAHGRELSYTQTEKSASLCSPLVDLEVVLVGADAVGLDLSVGRDAFRQNTDAGETREEYSG